MAHRSCARRCGGLVLTATAAGACLAAPAAGSTQIVRLSDPRTYSTTSSTITTNEGTTIPAGTVLPAGGGGAWNWCMDPRAFYDNGKVVTGWVGIDGDIQVGTFDLATQQRSVVTLHANFEEDDHDNTSFLKLPDGRYTVFYAGHSNNNLPVRYHVSAPGDPTSWGSATTIANVGNTWGATYPSPVAAPWAENQAYLFWRGGNRKPVFKTGAYNTTTATWSWSSTGQQLLGPSGGSGIRPYVEYASNGTDRIGFTFTEEHPRDFNNSIYYASIGRHTDDAVWFFRADGTPIKPLSSGALQASEAERVHSYATTGENAWGWDLAYDATGNPVTVFATFDPNNGTGSHRYHWARWNGSEWIDRTLVANAGGSVANSREPHYSGGITLDPTDPNIVYLARKVNGQFELEQWKTADGGLTWATLAITTASGNVENMRPVVPIDRPAGTEMVLWMAGDYDYYANYARDGESLWPRGNPIQYDTDIYLWTNTVPEPGGLLAGLAVGIALLRRRTQRQSHLP
jgi:hypothetical protein